MWFFSKKNSTVNNTEKTPLLPTRDLEANFPANEQQTIVSGVGIKPTKHEKKVASINKIIEHKQQELQSLISSYDTAIETIQKIPSFFRRHTTLAFGLFGSGVLFNSAGGWLLETGIEKELSDYSDREIYDIVFNMTIPSLNMTCGEILPEKANCHEGLNTNVTDCNKKYNDMCNADPGLGFILSGGLVIFFGLVVPYICLKYMKMEKISFKPQFKDLQSDDYVKVYDLLKNSNSFSNLDSNSLLEDILSVLEKQKESLAQPLQNEIKRYEIIKESLADIKKTNLKKFLLFCRTKNGEDDGLWRTLPKEIVNEIFSYIDHYEGAEVISSSLKK